jgi:hypothetical protein
MTSTTLSIDGHVLDNITWFTYTIKGMAWIIEHMIFTLHRDSTVIRCLLRSVRHLNIWTWLAWQFGAHGIPIRLAM